MASNLTFTANFADTARPTNGISSPTANQHWSNAVFTVSGKARDNVAVANVFYSLNGSGWAPAVTANNWSNWTAQVTLVPGTNTIQAYAVDTAGNFSTTNKASLVYILSAPLTVSTNGNGTVSPNYNGALLQIGANYSMTATASAGFGFTGWTGSSTTNGATLKFVMASNLTFTANFADTARPTNGISSPTANQHWSNAVFTVSGKARDNVAVANVFYSLNGSGWAPAVTANNWSNWTAQVTLVPGTNTIQAYAVDTAGNFSTTNKASLVYILSAPLTVSTNGNGTVSPNYNGALLQIGANYSMTATASAGFGFTGWTGSSTTNGATLKFVMASNLTFTANFADTARPTNGISSPTANQHWSNAVFTVSGKARDNVAVANVFYSLNGSGWAPAVTANNWSNWTAQVTLVPGTNTIQAYAMDTAGNFSTTNKASLVYINGAEVVWKKVGGGIDAYGQGIAVDSSGNVYVTGSTYNGENDDYLTIKYNSNGDTVWQKSYDGGSYSSDEGSAIAVDDTGNVYVTGSGVPSPVTIKYNSIGDIVWQKDNREDLGMQGGYGIAVDSSGNVYVAGQAVEGDEITIKCNSSGDIVWQKHDGDTGFGIAVDSYGNVYVIAASENGINGDYLTTKYNSSGDTVWQKRYDSGRSDGGTAIAVDFSGNVYVTGSSWNGANNDYLTIKYNSNGDTVWQKSYDGGYEDRGSGIAVDSSGNVYVIGVSCDSNGGGDYFTIKYNSNGDTVWQKRYDSGNGMNDYGFGIAVDSSGNVYVIGYSDTGTNRDYLTIKYRQY